MEHSMGFRTNSLHTYFMTVYIKTLSEQAIVRKQPGRSNLRSHTRGIIELILKSDAVTI